MKINIPQLNNTDEIDTIIFDLGGVIVDIDLDLTIEAFRKLEIKGLKAEDILANNQSLFQDLELGLVTPAEFVKRFYEIYPASKNIQKKAIWDAWNALLISYQRERVDLLKKLSTFYKLFLLSNTNLPHRLRFREMYQTQYGAYFDDLFIHCFYSDEMHLRKPNHEIFQRVTREVKTEPHKILFVDDSIANIVAANACGWNTYHLTRGECITNLFCE